MSGWFPRLSLDAWHLASGDTTIDVDLVQISADGTSPVWLNPTTTILYGRNSDGMLMQWSIWNSAPTPVSGATAIGGNVIGAGGGRWAVSRTDPPRIIFDNGQVQNGFVNPAFSDSGLAFACLAQSNNALYLNNQQVDGRPCQNPRFGSETLCWETNATIWGITTPGQPMIGLTIPGLRQYKPVPIWTGTSLLVMSHTDTNVILQKWGTTEGWVVYPATTDGPQDARPFDANHVRCVWSVQGVSQERIISINQQPTVNLQPGT
jgi:hypothetical protein